MIGFRNNRPLLKLGDCLITEYGEQWLADALEHAARRAGTTLPFKEDLLASVRYYLEHECDLSVMKVSELYARLRRMLTEVGLEHLARELREEMPPMTVCVAEIARSVPLLSGEGSAGTVPASLCWKTWTSFFPAMRSRRRIVNGTYPCRIGVFSCAIQQVPLSRLTEPVRSAARFCFS